MTTRIARKQPSILGSIATIFIMGLIRLFLMLKYSYGRAGITLQLQVADTAAAGSRRKMPVTGLGLSNPVREAASAAG
ncbi:hypothetical protein CWS02_13900 [Enterobacter sp. EA-1]|nr:hypothetical protein CWS02_13900 [Enterobacter sp. EA-1]